MNPLDAIAERRIAEAIEAGVFDDVSAHGRRLELEDLSGVADELRPGYLLLKGAGYLPEEMQVKRRLAELDDLLAATGDAELAEVRAERSRLALRYRVLMERHHEAGRSAAALAYLNRKRR